MKTKMKIIVISLGGSLIVPDKMDYSFLHKFNKTLKKHYRKNKFIIVCGGGRIARKYMQALQHQNKSRKDIALAGIMATRMNAKFIIKIFGKEANNHLPLSMTEIERDLKKNKVVICGALRYKPDSTSDGTAAKLAQYFKTEFINITNVPGLYNKDPNKYKNSKFIPRISWKKFNIMANKHKYVPGQHFILDQMASNIIYKNKIKCFIIGKDINNLNKLLCNKKFTGTIIEG